MSNTVLICTASGRTETAKSLSMNYGPEATIERLIRLERRTDRDMDFVRLVDLDYPREWWEFQKPYPSRWNGTIIEPKRPTDRIIVGWHEEKGMDRRIKAIQKFGGVVTLDEGYWFADWSAAYQRYTDLRMTPGVGPFGDTRVPLDLATLRR